MYNKIKSGLIGVFFILIPILLQIIFVDNTIFRWAYYRWYLFLVIFLMFILKYIKINKSFLANFLILYTVIGTSTALLFKYLKGISLDGEFLWDELSFAIGVIGVVYILILAVRQSKYKFTGILATLEFIVLLPYIMNIMYAVIERDIIDVNSFIAVYQTNSKEIIEFLLSSAPVYVHVILVLFLCCVYGFLYITIDNINVSTVSYKMGQLAVIGLAIVGILIITNKVVHYSYFVRVYAESKQYLQAVENYNIYRVDDNGKLKNIEADSKSNLDNETFIVVIGESQNRQHMSAYGYKRKTTPWLDKMLDNDNFVIMENGFACHTLTMMSLSQVLTEKSQYNKKPLEKSYSLIDIAKNAGYKTYWISNQAQFGSYNTPVTLIANFADEKIWINSDSSAGAKLDENVLEVMNTIPDSGKKIVFIHLFGNHWTYKHRYPAEKFNVFRDDNYECVEADVENTNEYNKKGIKSPPNVKSIKVVNEYDNSMLYNDYIMEQILAVSIKKWNAANIAYVADHGEAVKSDNKHIPSKYEPDMATIPVYFYFSDEYITKNAEKFNRIKESKKVAFTNDMMYNMLLDIWGIQTPYYDAEENCFSSSYAYSEDDLRILDNKKLY